MWVCRLARSEAWKNCSFRNTARAMMTTKNCKSNIYEAIVLGCGGTQSERRWLDSLPILWHVTFCRFPLKLYFVRNFTSVWATHCSMPKSSLLASQTDNIRAFCFYCSTELLFPSYFSCRITLYFAVARIDSWTVQFAFTSAHDMDRVSESVGA